MVATERPILVVDDDVKIVRLVRTYLEREGFDVIGAADGRSALAAITRHRPMLIVLDLMIPEVDGLAVIRVVRRSGDTPIIVLSARGTTADRITGLSQGADDYLPKPFSPAELVVRVKRVLARTSSAQPTAGHTALEAPPLRLGDLLVDRARHQVTVDGDPVELTALEFRLLRSLLEADGRVLTRDNLLDAVYGPDQDSILDRTIDVHVGRLREKLRDRAEGSRYIATVRGVGYRAAT